MRGLMACMSNTSRPSESEVSCPAYACLLRRAWLFGKMDNLLQNLQEFANWLRGHFLMCARKMDAVAMEFATLRLRLSNQLRGVR